MPATKNSESPSPKEIMRANQAVSDIIGKIGKPKENQQLIVKLLIPNKYNTLSRWSMGRYLLTLTSEKLKSLQTQAASWSIPPDLLLTLYKHPDATNIHQLCFPQLQYYDRSLTKDLTPSDVLSIQEVFSPFIYTFSLDLCKQQLHLLIKAVKTHKTLLAILDPEIQKIHKQNTSMKQAWINKCPIGSIKLLLPQLTYSDIKNFYRGAVQAALINNDQRNHEPTQNPTGQTTRDRYILWFTGKSTNTKQGLTLTTTHEATTAPHPML